MWGEPRLAECEVPWLSYSRLAPAFLPTGVLGSCAQHREACAALDLRRRERT